VGKYGRVAVIAANLSIDAVAFAMLRGEQEIAHQIALRNCKGNEL
jgi:hypothetical protein